MPVAHLAEQFHVLSHLPVVFVAVGAELEVDHDGLPAVGHHAVGAMLLHLAGFAVELQDGTLVEELPATGKPVGHLLRLQPFVNHASQTLGCEFFVVEHALLFEFPHGIVDVGRGADVGEKPVQDVACVG